MYFFFFLNHIVLNINYDVKSLIKNPSNSYFFISVRNLKKIDFLDILIAIQDLYRI